MLEHPILRQQIDDETAAYRSTIVEFMNNKVNSILLQIPMPLNAEGGPCKASELFDMYKITEIDILYKESDGLIVNIIDTIPSAIIADEAGEKIFMNIIINQQNHTKHYQQKT